VLGVCLSGNVDVSERCGCGDYGSSGSHHGRRLGGSHGSRRKPICYVRDPHQCELESPGRARWSKWKDGISYRECNYDEVVVPAMPPAPPSAPMPAACMCVEPEVKPVGARRLSVAEEVEGALDSTWEAEEVEGGEHVPRPVRELGGSPHYGHRPPPPPFPPWWWTHPHNPPCFSGGVNVAPRCHCGLHGTGQSDPFCYVVDPHGCPAAKRSKKFKGAGYMDCQYNPPPPIQPSPPPPPPPPPAPCPPPQDIGGGGIQACSLPPDTKKFSVTSAS